MIQANFRREGVFRIVQHVGNVNQLSFKKRASGHRTSAWLDRNTPDNVQELTREAEGLRPIENALVLPGDRPIVGFAEPGRRFNERLQYCLQIEGRAADDLQHIGGRGLLLQAIRAIR